MDNLDELKGKSLEEFYQIIAEKLGITIDSLILELTSYVSNSIDKVSKNIYHIFQYGDYGKPLEGAESIKDFLRKEATKPENWQLKCLEIYNKDANLLKFSFACTAVDEGENLVGFVFVDKNGKVKHCLTDYDD